MDSGNGKARLLPAVTALDLAGKPPLANLHPALTHLEIAGIVDLLASAERGKGGQSQINPDFCRLLFCTQWVPGMFDFARDGNEKLPCLGFRHGCILHRPFKLAMKNSLDPADLWQVNTPVCNLKPLRVAHRLLAMLALKSWVIGAPFKKVLVGFIKIHQCLLNDLAIRIFQPNVDPVNQDRASILRAKK